MAQIMTLDFQTNGPWEELAEVEERTLLHVILRLIGAFEKEGRSMQARLIHANL